MLSRIFLLLTAAALSASCAGGHRAAPEADASSIPGTGIPEGGTGRKPQAEKVDFERDIRPILEANCSPCHFEGGKMHAKMPFDDPETIRRLGTKLFSRIRDEADQVLILSFLSDEQP